MLRAPSPRTELISYIISPASTSFLSSSHPCSHNQINHSLPNPTITTGQNIALSSIAISTSCQAPARPPLPAAVFMLLKEDSMTKRTEKEEKLTTRNIHFSSLKGRQALLLWPTLEATTKNRSECGSAINCGTQSCGIATEQQFPHHHQRQHHPLAIVEFIPPSEEPLSSTSTNAATEQEKKQINSQIGAELIKSLKHSARMACCFCCCPVYRCVLWFCTLELICSLYFWYCELSELIRNSSNASIAMKDVLFLVLLSGWLITLVTSTVSIVIAQRKQDSQWILPRLVQQTGLLILGFLLAIFLVIYFLGGAHSINNTLISIYESLYSDQISRDARPGVHEDLRFYFLLLILFNFLFICYISSALCATKKLYREMQAETAVGNRLGFQPVNQYDSNGPPPQPPVNPHYKGAYA